jgi:hypothetical protein
MSLTSDVQGFVGQCVGFVETVLPWVPKGPATAAQYNNGALTSAGATRVQANAAQAGDVVVWPAGVAGSSSSAGHIAVVTGQTAGGDIQVAQANWLENGATSLMTIPMATAQKLSIYAPPPGQEQQSAINATTAAQAIHLNLGGQTAPGTGPAIVTTSSSSSAANPNCRGLTEVLSGNAAGSSLPVVGGVVGAVTGTAMAPVSLVEWAAQPCKRWSFVTYLGIAAALGLGAYLLFRRQVNDAVGAVTGAAAKVAE